MDFDITYFLEMIPTIASALHVTMELTIISLLCSLILGTIVALANYYNIVILNTVCKIYISIFRATPLLPQLFFFYFGLAYFSDYIKNMSPMMASTIILSLNMGAYMSENIRGALLAVDLGQIEAAMSLGMNRIQTMIRIVGVQAFQIALPSLFNNFIDLIKGSSIAFVVGVVDIMGKAKIEAANTFRFFEVYAAVMLIYWVLITILSYFQKKIEQRYLKMS